MAGIGTNCGYYTLGGFLNAEKEKWLKKMEKKAVYDVAEGNIKAWADEFDVLQEALSVLPESYHNVHIIFEYGLPYKNFDPPPKADDPAVFADAIILSKNTVVVLEFKQAKDAFVGYLRQARKYRKRIQQHHDESRGMNKRAILVLTKGKEIRQKEYKANCCSRELLAQAVMDALGENPKRHCDVEQWCNSSFS